MLHSQISDTTTLAERPSFAIDARNVEMRFSGNLALKGVNVQTAHGSIHALCGENGAGKSTFLGILAGRIKPTSGSVDIFGLPHPFGTPRHARQAGIAAIYQELTIVPALTAMDNVFLGQTLSKGGFLSERAMRGVYDELCHQLEVSIPADTRAGDLSVADQQMLEIMRGIQSKARLLLFDEPTTSLATAERAALFRIMRQLKSQGTTMILVSHNLEEVLAIADHVTVFRDGNAVASEPRDFWTKKSLVKAMIGHDVAEPTFTPRNIALAAGTPPAFEAKGVTLKNAIDGIDISVYPGEIVGIGGLVGSGRTSLLRCLAGLEPNSTGEMLVNGEAVAWPTTPRHSLRHGIALVPEDRKLQGLVLSMNCTDNISIANFSAVSRYGFLSRRIMLEQSKTVAREFGLSEARLGSTVRNLSGGNQQKVMLGKVRFAAPRILLVDEPTRGIDIGAKEEIMATLRRLAAEGLGIIMVSSDLEEVVAAADRVLVLSEGKPVTTFNAGSQSVRVKDILNAVFKVGRE